MKEIYKQHKLPALFYVVTAIDTLNVDGPRTSQFNSLCLTHKDNYSVLSTSTNDEEAICQLLCFVEQFLDVKKLDDPLDCLPYTHVSIDNDNYKDFTPTLASNLVKSKQTQL